MSVSGEQREILEDIRYCVRDYNDSVIITTDEADAVVFRRLGLRSVITIPPGLWTKQMAEPLAFCRAIVLPSPLNNGYGAAELMERDINRMGGSCAIIEFEDNTPGCWAESPEITSENVLRRLYALTPTGRGAVCAESIKKSEPEWLVEDMIQFGRGTLLQGVGGAGKTAVLCKIAAHVSTGTSLFGHRVTPSGTVLIFSAEDDESVLRGRLEASGANLRHVFFPARETCASAFFGSDVIRRLIDDMRPSLVIFDPIQQYIGPGVDMNRANETRPVLSRLFALAQRYRFAVLITSHITKAVTGRTVSTLSLGSTDINASMRSIFHVMADPKERGRSLLVHVKSSDSARIPTLQFRIIDHGGVEWIDECSFSAEDADAAIESVTRPGTSAADIENHAVTLALLDLVDSVPLGSFIPYSEVERAVLCRDPESGYASGRRLAAFLKDETLRSWFLNEQGLVLKTGIVSAGNRRGLTFTSARFTRDGEMVDPDAPEEA